MPRRAKLPFCYEYPRPAVTVDIALVTLDEDPRILLIQRKNDPGAGQWALPGGFVNENEKLIDAAQRELKEETSLEVADLEQLYTFGDPGRDPRGWTITVAFIARIDGTKAKPEAGDDAGEVGWFSFQTLPELAFDHAEIIRHVSGRLKLGSASR